jgi:hypothetical protein
MISLRICIHGSYFSLNASGNYLEPNAREQLPLGAKSTEDPDSAIHEHCSSKTLCTWGEKPCRLVFQQCVLAGHHSQCTPSVNKRAC